MCRHSPSFWCAFVSVCLFIYYIVSKCIEQKGLKEQIDCKFTESTYKIYEESRNILVENEWKMIEENQRKTNHQRIWHLNEQWNFIQIRN